MSTLFIVGIGPGNWKKMTLEAADALLKCDVIVGYTTYIDLVREHLPGKELLSTPMRREVERCHLAFAQAQEGKTVAMICSGDAGVYGMAGPMLEIAAEYPGVELKIIPGVTAALSGAALLGSPLTNDFCLISLSDLLTPWETIAKRLKGAAEADLVIVLYNPGSERRKDRLRRACDIVLAARDADTVCGLVRNIGRKGEEKRLLSLAELHDTEVDMFTTVFIGNSETRKIDDFLVTSRGYRL